MAIHGITGSAPSSTKYIIPGEIWSPEISQGVAALGEVVLRDNIVRNTSGSSSYYYSQCGGFYPVDNGSGGLQWIIFTQFNNDAGKPSIHKVTKPGSLTVKPASTGGQQKPNMAALSPVFKAVAGTLSTSGVAFHASKLLGATNPWYWAVTAGLSFAPALADSLFDAVKNFSFTPPVSSSSYVYTPAQGSIVKLTSEVLTSTYSNAGKVDGSAASILDFKDFINQNNTDTKNFAQAVADKYVTVIDDIILNQDNSYAGSTQIDTNSDGFTDLAQTVLDLLRDYSSIFSDAATDSTRKSFNDMTKAEFIETWETIRDFTDDKGQKNKLSRLLYDLSSQAVPVDYFLSAIV